MGDGSTRSFYRIHTDYKPYILLIDPGWQFSRDYPDLQIFLSSRHIPVPEFYGHDANLGCLLMEDLGEILLQDYLVTHPDEKRILLKQAIIILARLHGRTLPMPAALPAAQRHFDTDKYFQELQHTGEHLITKLLKLTPWNSSQLSQLYAYCEHISQIQPPVFCHRDYHCRNILIQNGKLYLIDFQDARMGSPHYDLASILYDPYTQISDQMRNELIDIYRREISNYPIGRNIGWDNFERHLAWVGWQRMVKAAGSFASFFTRHGKTTHLPYLLPALQTAISLMDNFNEKPIIVDLQINRWIDRWHEIASSVQTKGT